MAFPNVFSGDAFSTVELTDAINIVPNKYGRLQQMGLFPARGVRQTTIMLEVKDGVLNLLPTVPRGGPPTEGSVGKRRAKTVNIPHIPHHDMAMADDVQNVRSFGSENQLMAFQELVNEKLMTMREKHDITLEYLRWGALNGVILDADGTTILSLFDFLEVTEEVQDFALDSDTTDVLAKIIALKRYFEFTVQGISYERIHVMCSNGFFDALIAHDAFKAAWERFQNGQAFREDLRNGFLWGDVFFENHSGTAVDIAGNVRKFIADDTARAFPVGGSAASLYQTYFAPATFIESVNTAGREVYAKQQVQKWDEGIEFLTQSNPLPVVKRPEVLVKLTIT